MTVEQWLSDLVAQLPNLAIALLVLYWQRQTIDSLLNHQRQLIDKLVEMVDEVREVDKIQMTAPKEPTLPRN